MNMERRLTAEERKQSIAQAVMSLFAEKGFSGATTKELAKAAGVSEALLYRYFPSKEALYSEIQQLCCQKDPEMLNALAKLPPSASSLVITIYALFASIVYGKGGFETQHKTLKRMMLHSLVDDGKFARTFLETKSAEWIPFIKKFLDAAVLSEDLRPLKGSLIDRVWLAHHLAMAMGFLSLPTLVVVDYEENSDTIINSAVEFTLRGLGLKDESIAKLYNPEAFKMMIG